MPTIISITEYPSMPGRYKWSVKTGKKELFGDIMGGGVEAAAAVAVEKATTFGDEEGYSIFAPKVVLAMIPEDMRNSRPVGRPAEMDGGKRVQVYLDAESTKIAKKLGNGNVSEGIRISLSKHNC